MGLLTFRVSLKAAMEFGADDEEIDNWTDATGTTQSTYSETTDAVFSEATGVVTLGSNVTTNTFRLIFKRTAM